MSRKSFISLFMCIILVVGIFLPLPASAKEKANAFEIPDGVEEYNGHYYMIFNKPMSWKKAKKACEKLGGHLVTINSSGEQKFIVDLMKKTTASVGDSYWIGLTDEKKEGVWQWVTGEKVNYTHWNSVNPDNQDNSQHYVRIMWKKSPKGQKWKVKVGDWDDVQVEYPDNSGYICEWEGKIVPEEIILSGPMVVMAGKTIQLKAVVSPSGADQGVKWTSSDEKIATVDDQGTVKGIKAGSVKITVTSTADKKIKASVKIKVKSETKYRALVIGNSNYDNGDNLPSAKYDAQAMKGMLESSLVTKYDVLKKEDRKASEIVGLIYDTFEEATENDVSLFYYSGHGSVKNIGALVGVDGDIVMPETLRDALIKVPGQVIVILASCYSGAMITEADELNSRPNPSDFNRAVINAFSGYTLSSNSAANSGELMNSKFIVLTACAGDETAKCFDTGTEIPVIGLHYGLFTKALLDGLGCSWPSGKYSGSGPCVGKEDSIATLGKVQSYLLTRIAQLRKEHKITEIQTCMKYGDNHYPLFQMKKK